MSMTASGLVAALTSMEREPAGCAPCQLRSSQVTTNPDNLSVTSLASRVPEVAAAQAAAAEEAAAENRAFKAAAQIVAEDSAAPIHSTAEWPRWEGPICYEGKVTGDGRMIAKNGLRWENLPLPMRYVGSDVGLHDGAEAVGHILTLTRRPGGVIWATGDLDPASAIGQEALRAVATQLSDGVSVDLDDVAFEIRVAKDVLDEMQAEMDQFLEAVSDEDPEPEDPAPEPEVDEDGRVTVMKIDPDVELMVTTSARIRAATIVSIPAFDEARISLVEAPVEDRAMAASAAAPGSVDVPVIPPGEWFENPGLTAPTPLTVTEEGRVFGHIATWDTCHISYLQGGKCIPPMRSKSGYHWFHQGPELVTTTGTLKGVGKITMAGDHPPLEMSAEWVVRHYDNTGTVAADVRAGEDAIGIWVAGALRPGLTPAQVREFRAAPVSGDWRDHELRAVLSVNVPGFPIPKGLVASGELVSMVAAGMLAPVASRPTAPDDATIELVQNHLKARELRDLVTSTQAARLARRVKQAVG